MKISHLILGLTLSALPVWAQTTVPNVTTLPSAPQMATVTPFITGLKEPQGMAYNGSDTLVICDYGAGEVLRFSREGQALGKLATGLNGPTAIVSAGDGTTIVSETKANRVLGFRDGKKSVEMDDIQEPIGLINMDVIDNANSRPYSHVMMVASRTTSKIYIVFPSAKPIAKPIVKTQGDNNEELYAFSWMLSAPYPLSSKIKLLVSDEKGGRILRVSTDGHIAPFASGISKPSGLASGPDDRMVYVVNEANSGQLIRLDSEGKKTVVAENLGRPCGIVFVGDKTALVSNRDGNVWKVVLP